MQAAVLALLLPAGSKRALRAWKIETDATPSAESLLTSSRRSRARPACRGSRRCGAHRGQPLAARQALLQSTRRIMGARGTARPIDRLHWLTMRRGLGESAPLAARPETNVEVAEWLESDVLTSPATPRSSRAWCPPTTSTAKPGTWYDAVMSTWQPFADIPAWEPPNAEAMVEALAGCRRFHGCSGR